MAAASGGAIGVVAARELMEAEISAEVGAGLREVSPEGRDDPILAA
jgi:hypothetical protein